MLSVYKKNTIFGRNNNSNLPLYYDNVVVEGKTSQATSILPSEYTQVDYITLTGTQYLNTNYKLWNSTNWKIELDFSISENYNYNAIFGFDDITDTNNEVWIYSTSAYAWRACGKTNTNVTSIPPNERIVMTHDNKSTGFRIDKNGTNVWNTTQLTGTADHNLCVGHRQGGGWLKGKIYSIKMYSNSAMVRNFIPCYRNSDNVVGMYDLVNDTFYTNSGTGTFAYGNVVNIPNPEFPSELVSVGYENLFNKNATFDISQNVSVTTLDTGIRVSLTETGTYKSAYYVFGGSELLGKTLTITSNISASASNTGRIILSYGSSSNGSISRIVTIDNSGSTIVTLSSSFPSGADRIYIFLYANVNGIGNINDYVDYTNLQIEINTQLNTQPHSYIPYGKYGLEVKTTGKNLIPFTTQDFTLNDVQYYIDNGSFYFNGTSTSETSSLNADFKNNFNFTLPSGTYTISHKPGIMACYLYKYDDNTSILTLGTDATSQTFTLSETTKVFIGFYVYQKTFDNVNSEIMISKSGGTYEPYIEHTNLISLDNPLRSIGDTKDLLYIRNGMLYVERKIGSVVLNGSESGWTYNSTYKQYQLSNSTLIKGVKNSGRLMSNYFVSTNISGNYQVRIGNTSYLLWIFDKTDYFGANTDSFKTWLSTHNTEVNYILAESIIESYELDMQPMIFESLGYGILSDVVSDSLITEELNGSYVLEFEYMKNGKFSEFLIEENIIKAHGEPFSIYSVKKDTDGKIKILAKHWVLNEWTKDFILDSAPTDLVAQSALNWIQERSINHSNILITGDCDSMASTRYVRKNMLDAIFKEDNSILNRFGGELSYNKNNVTINKHRGNSVGITIRQGKNITGAEYYLDFSTVTTRLVPVGKDGLMINDIYVDSPLIDKYATPIIRKVDVDTDSTEELENYCNQLFESGIDKPTVSIKIDFIELSKTTEYKNYSSLETAHLGDTVIAYIPSLNLNISTRVVKVVYNDNLQRITSLELGSITQNIATSNVNFERKMQKQIDLLVASDSSVLEEAKQNATDLINHPFGGHIYIDENSGNMYIMDTTDINTAQNIWRWGLGGLGFSSTGINGPYGVAMTQDGKIVADYITAGVLSANVISSMNLNLTSKNISISSTNFTVSPDGTINAKNGKFSGSVEIEGDKPNYSNDDDADLYVHYHELEEDVEGFDGTGEIETTNESKVFSNGVFLQSKYNNSVPGSTSNTNGLDRVSQLNIDSYSSYEPVVIRRFFRDSNDNISGESNSIMKYGGFEAHDAATGDFSVIGSEIVLTDSNNKSITISPNSIPTPVLSNWYSTTAATLTGAKNHKLLVILARPGSSSAIMSLIIPTDCLTTSNQEFQVADESNYVSFNIKYSGSNILIAGASRSNYGSIISAWTML